MDGKENKYDDKWMPYHEYVMEQYFRGRATKEEYDLALEYEKEKNKNTGGKVMNYNEWLEKKNN